ncbi:MAG: GNAT family N-acetyltransferase [Parvibaculum sp.]|uniref:GNAT family N-acetyltransferase n=1 Tax=Parvibaculum sp. TaxID=2024848 RepID=UPI0027313670|nr:GNAT family N-acetyltransferase [Parvibaculum sp.]MDP2150627.1 GNAT family N-acetyltransferase [Parvibaculum sp.]
MRVASAGDIPALARVWHDGWHAGHAHLSPDIAALRPLSFFEPRMATTLPDCVVACVDGDIVGFAGWEGDGIGQVFVLPAWHGRGVAPRVLAAAEEELKRAGYSRIWLQCQLGNARARRFYEKHGWQVAAELDVTIGTTEGRKPQRVWRMEKSLA